MRHIENDWYQATEGHFYTPGVLVCLSEAAARLGEMRERRESESARLRPIASASVAGHRRDTGGTTGIVPLRRQSESGA